VIARLAIGGPKQVAAEFDDGGGIVRTAVQSDGCVTRYLVLWASGWRLAPNDPPEYQHVRYAFIQATPCAA